MKPDYIVITNCTARKRVGVPLALMAPPPASGGLEALVSSWREALASQEPSIAAGALYVGRSINEAKAAAALLGSQLFVISAGLGLVPADQLVPGYDLSAGGVAAGLPALLAARGAVVTDWWRELTQDQGLNRLMRDAPTAVVLLALPADYLGLISADIASLPCSSATRLRIFTSGHGRRMLSGRQDLAIMPYDERLESLPGFTGTRADFPQRAMRHFVSQLNGHQLAAKAAFHAVEQALSVCIAPTVPTRRRLTDDEICVLIRKGWTKCGGSGARLLRYLRDDELVACEQGRFATLRRQVAEQMTTLKTTEKRGTRVR
jgi:hypothetical protein